MNYHLHHQGQDLGVFSLEELQRRHRAGELSGSEWVWCEGMTEWQSLDSLLHARLGLDSSSAVVVPSQDSQKRPRWGMIGGVAAGVSILLILILIGLWKIPARQTRERQTSSAGRRESETSEGAQRQGSSALAPASNQVNSNTNGVTELSLREKRRAFLTRQYSDEYKLRGNHDGQPDPAVSKAIKAWIDRTTDAPWRVNPAIGVGPSYPLNARPGNDPVLLTIAAQTTRDRDQASRLSEEALRGLDASKYRAFLKFRMAVLLAAQLTEDDTNRVPEVDRSACKRLQESFSDGSLRPEDQDEVAEVLVNDWGQSFFTRNVNTVPAIVKTAGKPFEWLALLVEGESHIKQAWEARGTDYADKVTQAGWKGFAQHLAFARPSLARAWELRPDLPMAPTRMMTVSLGESGISEMRTWFDRAVAAQFDYPGAWREMRWGLRPRWHGDLQSMVAFGITAAETKRYDTAVPHMLLNSLADVEEEMEPGAGHVFGREEIWPHLQGMFEGYLAEPALQGDRYRLRSEYAVIAYLARKYELAAQLMEKVHWRPWELPVNQHGLDMGTMIQDVKMHANPFADQLSKAESKRKSGDAASASRLYSELATNASLDQDTRALVQNRQATLDLGNRMRQGEWVDFLPASDDLAGWDASLGKWRRQADGAMEVEPVFQGHMLYCQAQIGTNFEVSGSFEVMRAPKNEFQAGLVAGLPRFDSLGWYSFRMKHTRTEGDVASLTVNWMEDNAIVKPISLHGNTNSFYLRFRQGKVSATVNGLEVFKEVVPPMSSKLPRSEFFLGIGARNDLTEAAIRYRDLKVRMLPAGMNQAP